MILNDLFDLSIIRRLKSDLIYHFNRVNFDLLINRHFKRDLFMIIIILNDIMSDLSIIRHLKSDLIYNLIILPLIY